MKLLQETQEEPNDVHQRINQMIHLMQSKEEVYNRNQVIRENIKKIYDENQRG